MNQIASKFLYTVLLHFVILNHFVLAQSQQEENQFIYNGFTTANLQLNGSAEIHPNGLLQLANSSPMQFGRAFLPIPLSFNTSFSFSTSFVFAIVPETSILGGHGMTFTISPSADFPGAMAAEYLGLLNGANNGQSSNHLLAVELDTIKSLDMRDIDNNHVGIDINGLASIESAPAAYFSDEERVNKSLNLISGNPIQVWIDYDEMEKKLNVTLAPVSSSKKPSTPLLSANLNLSTVLLDSMHVGFSASTGSMTSRHYVLGWSFKKGDQAPSLDISNLPSVPSQSLPSAPSPSPSKSSTGGLDLRIMIPVTTMIVLFLVSGLLLVLRMRKYKELREDWEKEYGPQRFSYKDLYKATKGFKDKDLLGAGGFGRVYKGVLPCSKTHVAIKKVTHNSPQGMKEFVAEIASMGRLRHRNLVQLLGYCRRKGELLLVYEYMPYGSLDKFLFANDKPILNWFHRYQIIKGVASALLYLHEEWEQVVIHRDVKASNVLLDADLNARLGDFGLAKFYDHGSDPQTTCLVGTVGYLAPELTQIGKATTGSDVFSFGVFMLEMACGRRPVDGERPPEEMVMVNWVVGCLRRGSLLQTSDPRLEGDYVEEEMELVLKLALICAHPTPAIRPSMRQVVQYLDGNLSLPEIIVPIEPTTHLGLAAINQVITGENYSLDSISNGHFIDSLSITSSILSCSR